MAFLFLLSLVLSVPVDAAAPPANAPTFKHLDGKWRTSEGEIVVLSDVGAVDVDVFNGGVGPLHEGGLLTSTIDSGGDCPGARTKYLEVRVQGGKLIGTMQRCAHPILAAPPCNFPTAWETKVRLTVQTSDFISGYYHSEWFAGVSKPEKGKCPYSQDHSRDSEKPFNLTRCPASGCSGPAVSDAGGSPCPDTGEVGALKDAVDKFIKVNNYLEGRATTSSIGTPNTLTAFKKLSTDMGAVSNGLGAVTGVTEKCERVVKLVGLLSDFAAAINEVDGAGCSGHALAAGFDHLARATGNLGGEIGGDLPGGLGTAFTLLAADQNFFTKVGGALSQPAGAGQFPFVDGYTPDTCN